MNIQHILKYLGHIAKNNDRNWYRAHKDEYLACHNDFEEGVDCAIAAISKFDVSVSHVTAKEAYFRFNRDTRFSPDKSPYKRHFGTYISTKRHKSSHAGYYIHMQPGHYLLSARSYWLPTHVLISYRSEVMSNIDEWWKCVESGKSIHFFGYATQSSWSDEQASGKGFGVNRSKTCPEDFPADYEFIDYPRTKDYVYWYRVEDDFFTGNGWIEPMAGLFKVAQPMMEFTNRTIDDYE